MMEGRWEGNSDGERAGRELASVEVNFSIEEVSEEVVGEAIM